MITLDTIIDDFETDLADLPRTISSGMSHRDASRIELIAQRRLEAIFAEARRRVEVWRDSRSTSVDILEAVIAEGADDDGQR